MTGTVKCNRSVVIARKVLNFHLTSRVAGRNERSHESPSREERPVASPSPAPTTQGGSVRRPRKPTAKQTRISLSLDQARRDYLRQYIVSRWRREHSRALRDVVIIRRYILRRPATGDGQVATYLTFRVYHPRCRARR